jgi:dTDP-4-dehydrorhamnose 3,5-epimerase
MREIRLGQSGLKGIDGVVIKNLVQHHDERGYLEEIIRGSDDKFKKFGQVYMTMTYDGAVKAWHQHNMQTDCVCCIKGMIKLVMVDTRFPDIGSLDSDRKLWYVPTYTTYGNLLEIFIGEHNPCTVIIPPGVMHGWKAYNGDAYIVNIPDNEYDNKRPDEIRYPPDHTFRFKNYSHDSSGYDDGYTYNWSRIDC